MKNKYCFRWICTVGAVLVFLSTAGQVPAKRPNVLWLVAEDMNPWMSCYGEKAIETPEFDRFAAQGVRFDRFYVASPVCSPSHTAFELGAMATTYNGHHHRPQGGNPLPPEVKTVTVAFQEAGYATFHRGKNHFNFDLKAKTMSMVSGWDEAKAQGKPWFGQLQLDGGKGGSRHLDKGESKSLVDLPAIRVPSYYPDTESFKNLIKGHLLAVRGSGVQMQIILDELEASGQADDTIVFFTSDHGMPGGPRHKQFCYEGGIQVPLLIRWPKNFPLTESGKMRSDLVSGIDLAPTALGLAGIPIPKSMEGRNVFAPDYEEKDYVVATRDRCDFTVDRIRAVVGKRFKYIRNFRTDRRYMENSYRAAKENSHWNQLRQLYLEGRLNPVQALFAGDVRPAEEFYDLETDPDEVNNLANFPEYQKRVAEFRDRLERWMKETDDQGQYPETVDQLADVVRGWGAENCTAPDYDPVYEEYPELRNHRKPEKKKGKKKE